MPAMSSPWEEVIFNLVLRHTIKLLVVLQLRLAHGHKYLLKRVVPIHSRIEVSPENCTPSLLRHHSVDWQGAELTPKTTRVPPQRPYVVQSPQLLHSPIVILFSQIFDNQDLVVVYSSLMLWMMAQGYDAPPEFSFSGALEEGSDFPILPEPLSGVFVFSNVEKDLCLVPMQL